MNNYIVAGILRPAMWHWENDHKEMPRIWIQSGHSGPVFYTEQQAYERARDLNATADEHSIRNAQAIQLKRDDYAPY